MKSKLSFDEFKLNSDGMIPVITQDYKTYFSRSRQELWTKGDTSGHYQYVKSLDIDCDKDTILAKVEQIGAACHTGNRTCFFTRLAEE